jgi:hypothetical protein
MGLVILGKQKKKHTTEPLVLDPKALEFDVAIEMVNTHK